MQLASLALAASAFVVAGPAAPHPPPDLPAVSAAPPVQSQRVQVPGARQVNRRFGFGANVGLGTNVAGGTFRYWFGDRVGVDMNAVWARPFSRTGVDSGSTLLLAPSAIVMLRTYDDDKDVNLQPYIGGGLNYARQSGRAEADGGTASGTGSQLFGGMELSFHDVPNIVISATVVRYWLPDEFFGLSRSFDRTQVVGAVYLYF